VKYLMRPEAAPCELWLAMTAKMIQTQEHRHSRREPASAGVAARMNVLSSASCGSVAVAATLDAKRSCLPTLLIPVNERPRRRRPASALV